MGSTAEAHDGYSLLEANQRASRPRNAFRQLAVIGALLFLCVRGFLGLGPSLQWSKLTSQNVGLTTWPLEIEDGGDLVVYWRQDVPVTKRDYLTLSCGPQNGPEDFLLRKNVTEHDATVNSVRFSDLYMLRCKYRVQYFTYRERSEDFELVGTIEVPMRDSINAPKHGHIAFTTDPNAMAIMFNSASNRTPEVRYGSAPDQLTKRETGTTTTYSATDMCEAPANIVAQRRFRDPGHFHTVIVKDLLPGSYYYYQFGNDEDGWSSVSRFRSRPPVETKRAKFIAYGDMGVDGAPAAASTAMRVYNDAVGHGFDSFLLHFGDVSYARSEGFVWDKFFHIIEPYASVMPYMVTVGNHEYDHTSGNEKDPSGIDNFRPHWGNYGRDSGGECAVPIAHRFHSPATGKGIFWYSFNYGGVHVVQLSSEHNWTRGSEQHEWFERDLSSVNRSETPWIVVTSHRMMYSTQIGLEKDMKIGEHMREEIEDLLMEHKVNLVLAGHQHSYERSCALYQAECVEDGKSAPVYLIVGSAGFGLGRTPFSDKFGKWSLIHANEYGYLRVSTTETEMHVEFISNRHGDVFDEVTVTQYH